MSELSHFDSKGNAHMVDVGDKPETRRMARGRAVIRMNRSTADLIRSGDVKKGDVLNVARIAGISGTKWTPHLIPMCHPIVVDSVDIGFDWGGGDSDDWAELVVTSNVKCTGRTGVEMEALSAVSVSALTVYDMCKSVDREMTVSAIQLIEKTGGKSGHFVHQDFNVED